MTDAKEFDAAICSFLEFDRDKSSVESFSLPTNRGYTVTFHVTRRGGLVSVEVVKDGKTFAFSRRQPMSSDQGMLFYHQESAGFQMRLAVGFPNHFNGTVPCVGRRNETPFEFDGVWIAYSDWMFVAKRPTLYDDVNDAVEQRVVDLERDILEMIFQSGQTASVATEALRRVLAKISTEH